MNEHGELETLNFRGILSEIFYSWQLNSKMEHHHLKRHEDKDGKYITVDKLFICSESAQYKMENWKLEPGVWEKLNEFLDAMLPKLEVIDYYKGSMYVPRKEEEDEVSTKTSSET